MLMIGLGKHAGALTYHRILLDHPYDRVVRSVARVLLAGAPIAFGLAVVENGYDETALVEAVAPAAFEAREEHLLALARRLLPRLPWRRADLLVVDEIGKNVSGSGMDTNVVGRKRAFRGQPGPPELPAMRLIFVRDLTPETFGNAAGIGLADFTTTRLVKAMDYRATVINCLTAGYPVGANLPVYFETDREVIDAALQIIGTRQPPQARVLRIRNTLSVETVEVSPACLDQQAATRLDAIGPELPLAFDPVGNLPPFNDHDA
jgi:hypothetical protein